MNFGTNIVFDFGSFLFPTCREGTRPFASTPRPDGHRGCGVTAAVRAAVFF